MTGFGRAETASSRFVVSVEARSVNHRHLDIALRLPRALAALEADARKAIAARVERGRLDVSVQMSPGPGLAAQQLTVDVAVARQYVEQAQCLARELGIEEQVPFAWLLERPGIFRMEDVDVPDTATVWPFVAEALDRALDALVAQRAVEGAALATELYGRAGELEHEVAVVAHRAPAAAARREARLRERLRALVGELGIEEGRILVEAAAWAEKTDVAEELARLRSHLDQLRSMLDKGGPAGRPLDFLIQELHREVNTVGSKADDLEVSQAVLAAKGLIEKMREQVQNLE
jgi:uncharacterized protein (TIGR00255 family)